MGKFHWKDGIHFERTKDASVRVTRGRGFDDDGEELFTIDPNSWASIMAHVSALGGTSENYAAAQALHMGKVDA